MQKRRKLPTYFPPAIFSGQDAVDFTTKWYQVEDEKGDGNCFWSGILRQCVNPGTISKGKKKIRIQNVLQLRRAVYAWALKEENINTVFDIVSTYCEITFDDQNQEATETFFLDYLKTNILKNCVWADELEIKLVSMYLNQPIAIWTVKKGEWQANRKSKVDVTDNVKERLKQPPSVRYPDDAPVTSDTICLLQHYDTHFQSLLKTSAAYFHISKYL